ncbi:hypothetical protein ZIOFF_007631 [Zingiber officinale]|uniref:Uncharacterized protein n=1 Tax=Zingiber officinale TaxID=94328 RepID=A0A8J5M424_ZINOF|nr:hypothetical protein ZIOFF_007631 [Zingiber officinale]
MARPLRHIEYGSLFADGKQKEDPRPPDNPSNPYGFLKFPMGFNVELAPLASRIDVVALPRGKQVYEVNKNVRWANVYDPDEDFPEPAEYVNMIGLLKNRYYDLILSTKLAGLGHATFLFMTSARDKVSYVYPNVNAAGASLLLTETFTSPTMNLSKRGYHMYDEMEECILISPFPFSLILISLMLPFTFQLFDRPQWLTVKSRSQCYVDKIREELESRSCTIRTRCAVESVFSTDAGCCVVGEDCSKDIYDGCIISTYAPDALKLLGEQATSEEATILGAFQYVYSADPKGTGLRSDEIVSGMVEKLLQREENKALVDGLEKAFARVDRAREALADIER